LSGEKQFILWDKIQEISRFEMGWTWNKGYGDWAGNIDVDNVDVFRFPGWLETEAQVASLSAGDCLYLPEGWFHYVESKFGSRTSSVHVWFDRPPFWKNFFSCPIETAEPQSHCKYKDDEHFNHRKLFKILPLVNSVCGELSVQSRFFISQDGQGGLY